MYVLRRRSVECSFILLSVLKFALDEAVGEVGRTDMPLCFPHLQWRSVLPFWKIIDAAGQQMQNVISLYVQLEIFCRSLRQQKICYLWDWYGKSRTGERSNPGGGCAGAMPAASAAVWGVLL